MTLYKEPTEPLNRRRRFSRVRGRWTLGFGVGVARRPPLPRMLLVLPEYLADRQPAGDQQHAGAQSQERATAGPRQRPASSGFGEPGAAGCTGDLERGPV